MFCNKCGKELPAGSKFCPVCGAQVVENLYDHTEVKPTEIKPTEVKPTEVKPTEIGPSWMEPTPIEPTKIEPTKIEPTPIEPTPIEPTNIEPGVFPKGFKMARIALITVSIFELVFMLLGLLFGTGIIYFVLIAAALGGLIFMLTSFTMIKLEQKDLDWWNNYWITKNPKIKENANLKARYTFNSLADIKGFNRFNVVATRAKQSWMGAFFILAWLGILFGTVFPITGLGGLASEPNGVYVQTTAPYSGNGSVQVGKTAYKFENHLVYYAGYYEGETTGWGTGYSYNKLGQKVDFVFTGGGMRRRIEFYVVNFANDIAEDRFGFSIAYSKVQ